jgi:hypothetical protein
MAELQH